MCFHAFVELHFKEYSMFMRAGLPDDMKLLHALGPFYPPLDLQLRRSRSHGITPVKDFLDFLHESSLL